ncbi:MAG: hypothetical protein EPO12_08395 [Aquabacterium sp.]|nr:MAG: hypothetical protein EPO12_08395 [Aquabacterium sp.]
MPSPGADRREPLRAPPAGRSATRPAATARPARRRAAGTRWRGSIRRMPASARPAPRASPG